MSKVNFANGAAPPTPPLGTTELFVDTDKKVKQIDDAGLVTDLTTVGNGITQLTGDVAAGPGSGSQAATIQPQAVDNSKLINMVTARFKARATAGTGSPEDITGTQATALLDLFTSLLKGLVPPSGGGVTNFLRADGSWAAPSAGMFDPSTTSQGFDDFLNNADPDELGSQGWGISNNGTGTSPSTIAGIAERPGIIRFGTGSTAAGRGAIHLGQNALGPVLSLKNIVYTTSVRVSATALFTRIVAGLGDLFNANGDQNNGIYFAYDIGALETTWHLVCANGGVRTRRNTGITVVANTWYKLKFTVDAAGTSIQANIDGADVGAPITTNIPARPLNWLYKTDGVAAGVNADLDIDYWHYTQTGLTR